MVRNNNSVKGPTSALSSFLRERGISAIPHWRQRTDAQQATDAAGGQPENAEENGSAGANDIASHQNENENTAAANVPEEPPNGDGQFTSTRRKPANKRAKKRGPMFYLDEELRKKGKEKDDPSSESSGESGDDDSGSRCNRCRASIPSADKGASLCKDCMKLSTVPAEKKIPRKKDNAALAIRPVHEQSLDDSLNKNLLSLRDICVKMIIKYIDDVESFGIISDEAKDKICRILCKHRRLDDAVLQLFFDPSTEMLKLYDCAKITEDGFMSIAQFNPFLKELFLQECGQMTDNVAVYFGQHLASLTKLTISGGFLIKDSAMAQMISGLPHLQSLTLEYSPTISVQTLDAIAAKSQLSEIAIRNCIYIAADALSRLKALKECISLDISYCLNATDEMIAAVLAEMPDLQRIALSGCHMISGKVALNAVREFRELRELRLASLPLLLDDDLSALENVACDLQLLDVSRNLQLTGVKISELPLFALRTLSINGTSIVNSQCLEKILEKCSELRHLDVSWVPAFGDAAMDITLQNSKDLKRLAIWGCHRISEYNVNRWGELRRGLSIEGAPFI